MHVKQILSDLGSPEASLPNTSAYGSSAGVRVAPGISCLSVLAASYNGLPYIVTNRGSMMCVGTAARTQRAHALVQR
jgi:hypothetical protein